MGTSQGDAADSIVLSPLEIDAIGEVMNISMGSAATAVSQMLDKQVEITTPTVAVQTLNDVKHDRYEPALLVKIVYTVGLTGSNVMVFHQRDMQMILNTLMGISEPPSDNFEFDELSISAACEVMNQMMGSSSTALAEFLSKRIDISTPTATVMEENTFLEAMELPPETEVVTITFRLSIKDMVDSEFVSVLTVDLVKEMLAPFIGSDGGVAPLLQETPPPTPHEMPAGPDVLDPVEPMAPPPAAAVPPQTELQPPPQETAPVAAPPPPVPEAAPVQQVAPPPAAPAVPQPPPQAAPPPQAQPVYAQPVYAPPPPAPVYNPVDVRPVEFPEFAAGGYAGGEPLMGSNLDLIMNVPLEVSIEIGTTKRKIRDIMNFTSGTVIELDKQAGAPVDIVVNGQLIAHGDVVVIDDNFGVRITEIVGTKELINSLSAQQSG